jgi:hypothetical protein
MHLDNQALFAKALETVDTLGHKVVISKMNADTKKMIFETSIYMKINYYAKFCPWTLAQYRMIDSKVSKYYRLISRNMMSYPSKVLYFPVEEGGLGFKRFSDVAQSSKLALLGRLLVGGGSARVAMESIFERGFRAAGQVLPPGMGGAMGPTLGPTSWITSLQQWLGEIGVRLRKHGVEALPGNPQIIDTPSVSVEQRLCASRMGVSFVGDVHMVGDTEPPLPGLEWVRLCQPAPLSRIELRVGQIWFLAERTQNLFEIISFAEGAVMCVLWEVGYKPGRKGLLGRGAKVHMTEVNLSHGAGGGVPLTIASLVEGARGTRRLVFLSEERHYRGGVTGCTILGSRERCPDPGRVWSPPTLYNELMQVAGISSEIYTDGSYSKTSRAAGFYSGASDTKSGAGIAFFLPEGNEFHKVHIEGDHSLSNSYMTEMVALSLGVRLASSRSQVVYSDCAAALGSLRQLQAKKFHTSPYWMLDIFLDLDYSVRTEKVKAHPENRVIPVYSLQDRGITAADDCAGSSKLADRSITLQEALGILAGFCRVTLVNEDGSFAVDNLLSRRVDKDKKEYVIRRDGYRATRGLLPKWKDLNLKLGAYTLGCGKNGIAARGCASRIQFDWHYLGSNRVKSVTALADDLKCPLCGGCEDQRHVLTACLHPKMIRVRERVWGMLTSFLEDVRRGVTPLALDEARAVARADPKKEKVRLQREADRAALVKFRDDKARSRLSAYGFMLRGSFAAARAAKRVNTTAKLKVAAINAAQVVHHLMMFHQEGWTLMVGMPSSGVTQIINESILNTLGMRGYVAAELRRLQRAIGMSTWDIMTCHNRQVGGLSEVSTLDDFLQNDAEIEGQIFREGGTNARAAWSSRRRPLHGHKLRQASIASWSLPAADAVILLDILEYDLDTAALEDAAACDAKDFNQALPAPPLGDGRHVIGQGPVIPTGAITAKEGTGVAHLIIAAKGGGVVCALPDISSRAQRHIGLDAKRSGTFLHKDYSRKLDVSPFPAAGVGHPRLPGLSEVVVYSPIIRPYIPTKRKFQIYESKGTPQDSMNIPFVELPLRHDGQWGVTGDPCSSPWAQFNAGQGPCSPIYDVDSCDTRMGVSVFGEWALTQDNTSGDNRILSRRVDTEELMFSSNKIPGNGYCGYLSLELASRGEVDVGSPLDLRVQGDRDILQAFLISVSWGSGQAGREKLLGVVDTLAEGCFTPLPISSGLWMRSDDLPRFNLSLPVVLWGSELEGGWRRVVYPPGANRHVSLRQCASIIGTLGQLVWHENHYSVLSPTTARYCDLTGAWDAPPMVVGKRCYEEYETREGSYARNVKARTDVAFSDGTSSGQGNILSPTHESALMLGDTPLVKVPTSEGISDPLVERLPDFGSEGTTADLPPTSSGGGGYVTLIGAESEATALPGIVRPAAVHHTGVCPGKGSARPDIEVVDLVDGTNGVPQLWDQIGQWGFSKYPPRSRSNQMLVARYILEAEVERNCGRVNSDGLCGWLSLEWASRASDFPGNGLSLVVPHDIWQMKQFMRSLMVTAKGHALLKVHGILNYLHGVGPRILPKASGLWLGVEDIEDLHLQFPVVVWGPDCGEGLRRVMYPTRMNMGVSELDARSVMECEAQIVLDAEHFFPVDTVLIIPRRIGNRQRQEPQKGVGKRIRQLDAACVLSGSEVTVSISRHRRKTQRRERPPSLGVRSETFGGSPIVVVGAEAEGLATTHSAHGDGHDTTPIGSMVVLAPHRDLSRAPTQEAALSLKRRRDVECAQHPSADDRIRKLGRYCDEHNTSSDLLITTRPGGASPSTPERGVSPPPERDKKKSASGVEVLPDAGVLKRRRLFGPFSVGSPPFEQGSLWSHGLSVRADDGVYKLDGGGIGIPGWVSPTGEADLGLGAYSDPPLASSPLPPQGGLDDANHAADALDEDGRGIKTRPGLDRDKADGIIASIEDGRGGAPALPEVSQPLPGGRVCDLAADALDEDGGFKKRPGLDRDKPDEAAASVEAGRVGVPEQMADYAATCGP